MHNSVVQTYTLFTHSNNGSCVNSTSTIDCTSCFFLPLRVVHFPFNNLGLRAIIIRLCEENVQSFLDFALLITKVRSEYDAVCCAGITTNEVFNLNKLQGTFYLPPTFVSLLRLPQFIPCQLLQNSLARVLRWYSL